MKKIATSRIHYEQINLALEYIQNNFSTYITAEELANISGYSIFHFHRIFKDITGESVNDYIKNTRLEKASNLLLYNQHKNIETIANDVGFSTGTGFSAAFKKRFGSTPKEWRRGGYELNPLKASKNISVLEVDKNIDIKEPSIENCEILPIIYMRVFGYKCDMSDIWNKFQGWADENGVFNQTHKLIGLFHNHPSFLPYDKARYLACINTTKNIFRSGEVGRCRILDGKFAKFSFICTHLELYKLIHIAYTNWLPKSQYEVRNFPSYVEYKNPKALFENKVLEVDFFMPIQLKM